MPVDLGALVRKHNLYSGPRRVAAFRMLRRGASRLGLQVVPKTFYSAIPDLESLPAGTFERRSALAGLRFDLDEQLEWARTHLRSGMAEFRRPEVAGELARFYSRANPTYPLVDASVLYGLLRSLRPQRVVELGSGVSTLVTALALRANARDGAPAEFEVHDPFPGVVGDHLDGLTHLHRRRAQEVPLETFDALQSNDVLFVDTTHTVKIGSDVNFVVLEVLPRLAPGVLVHFHDIFLPYEYPQKWLEDFGLYWSEQYLLQAFLALNADFEILFAVAALARDRGIELAEILPAGVSFRPGAAFWLRRSA